MDTLGNLALSEAVDRAGIYPEKVIGGDKPYDKRSEWQEGWNACLHELMEDTCKIEDWIKAQESPLLERLLSEGHVHLMPEGDDNRIMVNCNDLFYWGCSDGEYISNEELPPLYDDIVSMEGFCKDTVGVDLWCCRKRKMRPQAPYYKYVPETVWHLFDACGPERTDPDGLRK